MTEPVPNSEAVLCAAYQEQAARYAQVLRLFEALPAAYQQGRTDAEALQQGLTLLNEVQAIQVQVAEATRAWQSSGRKPGPALSRAMSETKGLIERLLESVRVAEREAVAGRDRLVPELDHMLRGHQMQRAYGRGRSAPAP